MIDHNHKEDRNMTIANDIRRGLHDEDLEFIARAVQERQKALAPKARDFEVGDQVRFKSTTRPQYMRGVVGRISGIRQTKVTVTIEHSQGRFRAGSPIICPPSILEKL